VTPVLLSDRPATYAVDRAADAPAAASDGASTLAEAQPHLREEDLAHLWEGQRFPPGALRTRDGRPLQVVYRGRRNGGPGPDFVDAIIADDRGRLLKGDVELHVRASAFWGHGHHRDSRYDNLVLHVVFDDDSGEDTLLACGRRAAVVALAPWVARRAGQLRLWLVQPSLWEEPCRQAVPRLGWPAVQETLARLGRMRFRQKQSRFALALRRDGANQVLYEGLLRALGYSRNQEAFGYLARLLPYERLRNVLSEDGGPLAAEALLLGSAGLLPSQRGLAAAADPYVEELERLWAVRPGSRVPAELWSLQGMRPENQPARRLAAACPLLLRWPSLLASLRELPDERSGGSPQRLIAAWRVAADGFWRSHHDLAGERTGRPTGALLGRGRALELLVNVILPFAAAWAEAHDLDGLLRRANAAFLRLPRPGSYGATRFLEAALRPPPGQRGHRNACYQQGLLYLHQRYCAEGECCICPLSEGTGPSEA
jgi:hypothetical protein